MFPPSHSQLNEAQSPLKMVQLRTQGSLSPQHPVGGLASLLEKPAHRNLLLRLSTGGVWSRSRGSFLVPSPHWWNRCSLLVYWYVVCWEHWESSHPCCRSWGGGSMTGKASREKSQGGWPYSTEHSDPRAGVSLKEFSIGPLSISSEILPEGRRGSNLFPN